MLIIVNSAMHRILISSIKVFNRILNYIRTFLNLKMMLSVALVYREILEGF